MNLRGAKPVSDNKVKQFIESLNPVKDLYNPKLPQEFKYEFVDWILSSEFNFIKGIEEFPDITLCNGTVQAFDHFHYRHKEKRFRFFKGEFMYHQACLKNGSQFEWINDKPLMEGDALILSVPFSDRGIQHPATDMLLLNAEQFNIPVLLDFAYYPCTKNINLNLSNYPAVETITFSISKAFYGAEFLRVGVRLERANTDDGIDVFNSVDMHNRIDLSIASSLIKTFPVDWNWKTYTDVYNQVCEEKNLQLTDCIMFGLGGDEYKEYNRGGEVNRVCISDLIGEKVNDSSK
jgi:hypothetical protein